MSNQFFFNNDNYPTRKFSEIIDDIQSVKDYLGIVPEETFDDVLIEIIMNASASYIIDYTQLTIEELDKHYQSSLIFLIICSEMFLNRTASLSKPLLLYAEMYIE
ncbi:MAG: phage gp6-like head-tail connector protein [Clostridia bacterium]|nr:phage gp6-like head-tail connector protein [Clostridia bacterium]